MIIMLSVGGTPAFADTAARVLASTGLTVRSGPGTGYDAVGSLQNGTPVSVVCAVIGEHVAGQARSTDVWDRLSGDRYISHAYVAMSGSAPACPPRPALARAPRLPNEPYATMSPGRFIATAALGARRTQREFGVPASVTIAQAILESGWGKSSLAATDRNFFGIKCFTRGSIASGCRVHTTSECRPGGACYRTEARFRTYATATDSFREHGKLLATSPRYAAAFRYERNPDRFIEEIHKGGYATSPTYAQNVQRIMLQYDLRRFDVRR